MLNKALIFCLLLFPFYLKGGVFHETRAVWVATNFQIDWPRSRDFNEQQERLKGIIDDIAKKKFNVIYFQVRSNATVIYPSELEPFSPYFTGAINTMPPYDPLLLAINEAHKHSLEIHAWINVFKCFSGEDERIKKASNHVMNLHPEWVVPYNNNGKVSYWLDPGNPEVRNYLFKVIKELVVKYDVDGLNLDYLRYPGKDFDDNASFEKFGGGRNLEEWRRQNIIGFLKMLYKELKKIKPYLKIGVASIGIYKNRGNENNFDGYSSAYQDSYAFLKNRIVDYISPQVYWSTEDDPSFDYLVNEWTKNSSGRNIVIGIGIYKNQVASQLEKLIRIVHNSGAAGFALFRYGNIEQTNLKEFGNISLPAKMNWIKNKKLKSPENFTARLFSQNPFIIDFYWQAPPDENIRYYGLVAINNGKENIIKVLGKNNNSLRVKIDSAFRPIYRFALVAFDRLWNESPVSNMVVVKNTQVLREIAGYENISTPVLFKQKNNYTIAVTTNEAQTLELFVRGNLSEYRVVKTKIYKGDNLIEFVASENIKSIRIILNKSRKEYLLNLNSLR